MRTESINIYKFEELSESAKKTALSEYEDINYFHNWWDFTYEELSEVGIKVCGFDLYRNNIDIALLEGADIVAKKIIGGWGEQSKMYSLANKLLLDCKGVDPWEEEELEDLSNTFKKDLSKAILSTLDEEYQYLISDEAITEAIISNEYEFLEDGTRSPF